MKPTGKFLTAVFVILFVVLLGELGYIIYSNSLQKNASKEQPLPVPTLTTEQVDKIQTDDKNPTQGVAEDTHGMLKNLNQGVVVSSTAKNILQGNVIYINNGNDRFTIRIAGINGNTNTIAYTPEEVKQVTFSESTLNGTKPIKPTDIVVGDLVRIEDNVDLMKDVKNSFLPGKITVISQ